jgi:hypothetical protein
VPPELKKLKIQGIDVFPDSVRYIWVGGMSHTYLLVRKDDKGNFELIKSYNDDAPNPIKKTIKVEDCNQIKFNN